MTYARPHIYGMTYTKLGALFATENLTDNPAARARHLFREVYACRGEGLAAVGVSHRLKPRLEELLDFAMPLAIAAEDTSPSDGSHKWALRATSDSSLIETVLVPERGRLTLCISTQVGCRQACHFCQTARMGFRRHLAPEEIVAQVVLARMLGHPVSNVVLMGMGEPLDNLENVLTALDILVDDQGLRLSPNKVTLSTVGLLPQLDDFLTRSRACCALSLHSPFDEERSRLIPANGRHPIAKVVEVLRRHGEQSGRSYLIQYLLIQGVNDSPEHAQEVARIFAGVKVKVNLIPMNEHAGCTLLRPGLERVFRFQQALKELGLVATVRLSKGRDIQAACGQLVAQTRGA